MSLVRFVFLFVAALMIVPKPAHAEDDEVCLAWVHVFLDAEVEGDTVTITSEEKCLARGDSLDQLEIPDGNPYRGGPPEVSGNKECAWLRRQLFEQRFALADAKSHIAGAIEARDAADAASNDARAAYEAARDKWQAAQAKTQAAKAAYDDVYETDVEIERDASGQVVVVRHIGYRTNTVLGRAVLSAINAEAAAKAAMDLAWAKWMDGASPAAQAAQARVDQYTSVIQLYPDAIAATKALMDENGCKY